MPFDPLDFYKEATVWHAAPAASEASVRTVASRAYYAAYLCARSTAGPGWRKPHGLSKGSHVDLIEYFGKLPGVANRVIGNGLNQLFEIRKEADYELSPPFKIERAARALNLSKSILKALQLSP